MIHQGRQALLNNARPQRAVCDTARGAPVPRALLRLAYPLHGAQETRADQGSCSAQPRGDGGGNEGPGGALAVCNYGSPASLQR